MTDIRLTDNDTSHRKGKQNKTKQVAEPFQHMSPKVSQDLICRYYSLGLLYIYIITVYMAVSEEAEHRGTKGVL